jgi:hypothetical protein
MVPETMKKFETVKIPLLNNKKLIFQGVLIS